MSTNKIAWRRGFLEAFVIVTSILLAFGIQAWWDDVQDQDEEREILIGLELEFVDLRDRLQRMTAFNRWGVEITTRLLSDSVSSMRAASMDSAFSAATVGNVLDQGGALDALLSSGRLELIEDRELRARLGKWPDWLDDIHTNDLSARDFALRELTPFLASRGWPEFACPPDCRPPGPVPSRYIALLNDRELRALLITRRRWMSGIAEDHAAAEREAAALLEMIRTQLQR